MSRLLLTCFGVLAVIAAVQASFCFIKDGDTSNKFRFTENATDYMTAYYGNINGKVSYGHSQKSEGQYFFVYYTSPDTIQVFTWNNKTGSTFELYTKTIGFATPPVAAKFDIVSCFSDEIPNRDTQVQIQAPKENYNSTFCFRVNGDGTSNTKLSLSKVTEFGGFYATNSDNVAYPVYGFRANPNAPMIVFGDRSTLFLVYIIYWRPSSTPYYASKYFSNFKKLEPIYIRAGSVWSC